MFGFEGDNLALADASAFAAKLAKGSSVPMLFKMSAN